MSKTLKIFFPFGMFFILLIISVAGTSFLSGYYYYNYVKNEINQITIESKKTAITLAEASSDIAELSKGNDLKNRLNHFFRNKIDNKKFHSAFHVLEDGTILAHSSEEEVKEMNGNIASDEFKYNLDQIFYPLKYETGETYFSDYNIIEENIPFTSKELEYIKKYIYNSADRNGWIAVDTVRKKVKNKKGKYEYKMVGTVAFIVKKTAIYDTILNVKKSAIDNIIKLYIACFAISFILSILIYIRYNAIKRKSCFRDSSEEQPYNFEPVINMENDYTIETNNSAENEYPEIFISETGEKLDLNPEKYLKNTKFTEYSHNEDSTSIKRNNIRKNNFIYEENPEKPAPTMEIRDAIPVNKKVV